MNIRNYVNHIQNSGFYGWEIEISIVIDLNNINIANFNEIRDDKGNIIDYIYLGYYYSNDKQENSRLMLLSKRNHNNFNLIYYDNRQIDYNCHIEYIYINEFTYLNKILKKQSIFNNNDKPFKENEKIKKKTYQ